jgi:hypothetical protein
MIEYLEELSQSYIARMIFLAIALRYADIGMPSRIMLLLWLAQLAAPPKEPRVTIVARINGAILLYI